MEYSCTLWAVVGVLSDAGEEELLSEAEATAKTGRALCKGLDAGGYCFGHGKGSMNLQCTRDCMQRAADEAMVKAQCISGVGQTDIDLHVAMADSNMCVLLNWLNAEG